jgi:hypothetical protein
MIDDSATGASPVLLLEWWKPVVGFEGYYEVSNVGNVCRVKAHKNVLPFQRVRQWPHWDGRLFCVLSGGGKRKTYKVHKMMVDAFLGGTPDGFTVHHEDDCYTKNWISNFRYQSAIDNWRDGNLTGLMKHGSAHSNAKLSETQALELLGLYGKISLKRASERFGISTTAVSYLWRGRNWAHLQTDAAVLPQRKPVAKGNELPQAVLTPEKVKEIREQKGKADPKVLAKEYGVSHWAIYKIWSGKQWAWLE